MRILLDQNVPKGLRYALPRHEVWTARQRGWSELSNGALMAAAEAAMFDVLVTADQNLRHQQNLAGRRLAVVVLGTNTWVLIRTRGDAIATAIASLRPGDVVEVDLGSP